MTRIFMKKNNIELNIHKEGNRKLRKHILDIVQWQGKRRADRIIQGTMAPKSSRGNIRTTTGRLNTQYYATTKYVTQDYNIVQ